jgi:hypothetical protein
MSFRIPTFFYLQEKPELWYQFFSQVFGKWSGTILVKSEAIPFYGWDMDTVATFNVAYSQTPSRIAMGRIVSVSLMVFNDAQDVSTDASYGSGIDSITVQAVDQYVTITRKSGGIFDNASYSDDGVQRGVVTVWYTA